MKIGNATKNKLRWQLFMRTDGIEWFEYKKGSLDENLTTAPILTKKNNDRHWKVKMEVYSEGDLKGELTDCEWDWHVQATENRDSHGKLTGLTVSRVA